MTRTAGWWRDPARAPLSTGLCILGLLLGSLALPLATVAPAPDAPRAAGALLVTATRAEADLPGLEQGDPAALARALPGLEVGGARELEAVEIVPRFPGEGAPRVLAADPAWVALAGLHTARGRDLDAEDERQGAAVCLVSARVARLLEPGDQAARVKLNGTWWAVVGELAAPEHEAPVVDVLVPLRPGMLRMAPQQDSRLGELRVGAPQGAALLAPLVSRALVDLHGGPGAWRVAGQDDAPADQAVLVRAVRGLLVTLGACALLLGGLALRGWRSLGQGSFRLGVVLGLGVAVGLGGLALAGLAGPTIAAVLGLSGVVPAWGLVLALVGPVVGAGLAGVGPR